MTEALSASPRDLPQCLNGLLEIMRRLRVEYGVTIEYGQLCDPDAVGYYRAATNAILVVDDAPIDDQVALLADLWHLLSIGPEASRYGERAPSLTLVPPPRTTPDIDFG